MGAKRVCDGPFPSSVYFAETRFERETEASLLDEVLIAVLLTCRLLSDLLSSRTRREEGC